MDIRARGCNTVALDEYDPRWLYYIFCYLDPRGGQDFEL